MQLISCATIGGNYQNYAHLYTNTDQVVDPEYIIYHNEVDSSSVYFKINASKILYTRKSKTSPYLGKVTFHYRVYDQVDSKHIKDSGSFCLEDQVQELNNDVIRGQFKFDCKIGDYGLMKLFCTDINRDSKVEKHINLDKRSKQTAQFFLVKDHMGFPIFKNFVNKGQAIQLESNLNSSEYIYIRHYDREFPMSLPPFTASSNIPFDYVSEQINEFKVNQNGELKFNIPKDGFVHLQTDTLKNEGFTLFCFEDHFPTISTLELMVKPTRYICSKAEYDQLLNSELLKSAMDHFWKSKTGSKERAKEIIRKYYNRVENANQHFTSYVEGWKTDRGMVSIIYGPPNVVSKSKDMEMWIYGDENNVNSLSFVFNKMENPFSDNDYKLQRSPMYRSSWYRAVDAWRSGRAYWIQ